MLTWTPDLSVNVSEVDDQHKELFFRINRFLEALESRPDASALAEFFDYLEGYMNFHFGTEERYMEKYALYGYTDHDRHLSEHAVFRRDFAEFKNEMTRDGVSELMIGEWRNWITNWWLLHITRVDKGLGAFIREMILF